MLGSDFLGVRRRGAINAHTAGSKEPSMTAIAGDFVFFEQLADAARQAGDDPLFAAEHGRQVEFDARQFHAVLGEAYASLVVAFARFEQRLARDAADAQAGAAERFFFFDAGDSQAELSAADGGHVAARPRADHEQVIRCLFLWFVGHVIVLVVFRNSATQFAPAAADPRLFSPGDNLGAAVRRAMRPVDSNHLPRGKKPRPRLWDSSASYA